MSRESDNCIAAVAATDPSHSSTQEPAAVHPKMTLADVQAEYGWTFSSIADLWSQLEDASKWTQVERLKHQVLEFLDVEPPAISRVDGDALLRAINSRLDTPPIGSTADWLPLSDSERRAVWMLLERIQQGPAGLSLDPDLHRQIILSELDRCSQCGLPATTRTAIVELLEQTLPPAESDAPRSGDVSAPAQPERIATRARKPVSAGNREHHVPPLGKLIPWPEDVRAFPRCLVRGALLRPSKSEPITLRRETRVRSVGGIATTGRGRTLSQADLNVCLAAIHLARRQPFGQRVEVPLASFIRTAGRTDGERTRTGVTASMRRLTRFKISVDLEKTSVSFRGTLLQDVSVYRRRRDRRLCVSYVVPAGMTDLFAAGTLYVPLKARTSLARHPLASWLHLFVASHKSVYPIRVATYHELTGLRCSIDEFRRLLKGALEVLVAKGFVKSARIDRDLVVFKDADPDVGPGTE